MWRDTYYEAVKELAELAQAGNGGLTLMGIEPTYPSENMDISFQRMEIT